MYVCVKDDEILKDWKAGKKARWPRLPELRFKIGDRFLQYSCGVCMHVCMYESTKLCLFLFFSGLSAG